MSDRENRRAEAEARRATSHQPDSPPARDALMLRYLGAEMYAAHTGRSGTGAGQPTPRASPNPLSGGRESWRASTDRTVHGRPWPSPWTTRAAGARTCTWCGRSPLPSTGLPHTACRLRRRSRR